VIRSFRCDETKAVFERTGSKRLRTIEAAAYRRLLRLHAATSLLDLAAIRGNRLEALKGDRQGQHSVRVNDRYRICFVWSEGNADAVEIVDYHD
jgi:proteic killer suppression protein